VQATDIAHAVHSFYTMTSHAFTRC